MAQSQKGQPVMRLLLLNPNTSASVTERITNAAQVVAAATTEIVSATAPWGFPYIATRAEAVMGAAAVLEMLAEYHDQVDAAVIAAFGDPGLGGARELFDIPVIGLAEAGMLTACMLGRDFTIVTFSAALSPFYEECVAWHGLKARCAGVRALESNLGSIDTVQEELERHLIDLAKEAITNDRADVIVMAGAPLSGLARRVKDQIPVPVVDCVEASVKLAEALVAQQPRKAVAGTFKRPAAKSSSGLARMLADWIAHG